MRIAMARILLPFLAVLLGSTHACMPMKPGEDLPCPSSPPKLSPLPMDTTDLAYSDLPGKTVNAKGETVFKCPFNMVDSEDNARVAPARELVCKPNSGFFVLRENGAEKPLPDGVKYACSAKKCQSCASPTLLATSDNPCANPRNLYCSEKAMITPDPTTQCLSITCADAMSTISIVDALGEIQTLTGTPTCEDGTWKASGVAVNFDQGMVCSKPITCESCNSQFKTLYDTMNSDPYVDPAAAPASGTTCPYKCAGATSFIFSTSGDTYGSLTCDAITAMPTYGGGPALDKWKCAKCECVVGGTFCPLELDCNTAPVMIRPCVHQCPAGTTAYYLDTLGNKNTAAAGFEFKCQGVDFTSPPDWKTGLLCAKPRVCGAKPATSPCPALVTTPPYMGAPGTFTDLCYEKGVNQEDKVYCGSGVLHVGQGPPPGSFPELICSGGMWTAGTTAATCLPFSFGFADCDLLFMSKTDVLFECKDGACKATCSNGKTFSYMSQITPGQKTTAAVYCVGGELMTAENDLAEDAACV